MLQFLFVLCLSLVAKLFFFVVLLV
jgi:hypothetical protein